MTRRESIINSMSRAEVEMFINAGGIIPPPCCKALCIAQEIADEFRRRNRVVAFSEAEWLRHEDASAELTLAEVVVESTDFQ